MCFFLKIIIYLVYKNAVEEKRGKKCQTFAEVFLDSKKGYLGHLCDGQC